MRMPSGGRNGRRGLRPTPRKISEDRRDDLIEKVFLGELTPREAEEQARKEGLPKLAGEADPSIFNPMSEPDWTLLMAVAWIVFRDDHQVRLCADEYRTKCTDFAPFEKEGKTTYYLKTRDPVSRLHLDMTDASFDQHRRHVEMDVNQAITELRQSCGGKYNCQRKAERGRHSIDALLWIDLKIFPHNKDPGTVVSEKVRDESVLLPREKVIKIWPAKASGSAKRQGPRGPRPKKHRRPLMR